MSYRTPRNVAAAGLAAAALVMTAIAQTRPAPDTIYINGSIVTVDATGRTAQAVAVTGDKIAAVGTTAAIRALAGPNTKTVDLAGKTMIPGFVDAHSHFPGAGTDALYVVDLNSPPVGRIEKMDDLIQALKAKAQNTPRGQWITGRGYDQTLLAEKRHPTRDDLDKVSPDHPVYITHTSGHLAVANSLALKMAEITKDTPQPKGGVIQKDAKTGEPNGVFEESGGMVGRLVPQRSAAENLEGIKKAVQIYTAAGVTTSTIAGNGRQGILALQDAGAKGFVPIRITSMVRGAVPQQKEARAAITNSDMLKTGSVKIGHDGSIQGYTGFLLKPYYVQPEGQKDYRGYPSESKEELTGMVRALHAEGYQVAIHANGDAAIDDVIEAYRTVFKEKPKADHRFRIEHAQMTREDQLDAMKEIGISPSFFVSHTYFWGDVHRDIFMGPERAAHMSPLASALKKGVRFSIHLDSSVTPMSPLQAIWSAVNRVSRSGKVVGPDQRIRPAEAIRAVTIDAAWQNFEESVKGSIEPGKFADLTVLAENPLTVDPLKIKDIAVLETIVGGKSVFKKETSGTAAAQR